MNVCNFVGRLGRDAVVRHTTGGKAVTGWALAVDSGFGDAKQTTWVDCSLWGDRGPKIAEYIRKGDRIAVSGELGTRTHNDKTYVTLNVREVTLLGDKRASSSPARGPQSAPSPTPSQPSGGSFDDDLDAIPF